VAVAAAPRATIADATEHANPVFSNPLRITGLGGARTFPTTEPTGVEIQVQAIQDVPLRGVGAAREAVGRAELRTVDADIARARLDAAERAGIAWVNAREAQAIADLRQAGLGETITIAQTARAHVTAGTAAPHEQAIADAERALGEADVLHEQGMVTDALFELRLALGLRPDAPIALEGDLFAIDESPVDAQALREHAQREHPLSILADARTAVAWSDAKLAYALYAPMIGLGLNYLREGTGEQVFAGMFVLPLPWSNAGKFEERRAAGNAEAAAARAQLVRAERASAVEQALHEHEHTREEREAVMKALPLLREATRIIRAQFDTGTTEIGALVVVRRRLLDAEERYVHATADVRRADIRLAHAAGTLWKSR
jgi:outer membrane protein TolC